MINSSIVAETETRSVRIRIDDKQATIDVGHSRAFPIDVRVTELAVIYETRKNASDNTAVTTVSSITYVLDYEEYNVASIHPDFLDQPEEWPGWVRELVDQYRPAV